LLEFNTIILPVEILKLIIVLAAIIIALRKRVSVGVSLFGAGLFTAILFQIPIRELTVLYWDLLGSKNFIFLTGLVIVVTILGTLLKELGHLNRLASSCRGLYGGSRTAVVSMPPLVGLMPMPGGSLLSAPLVESVLKDEKYKPEFKCAANYWFRHMVEFSWPVYAGLILTEAITGLPIGKVSLLQLPLTLSALVIGFFFFARKIEQKEMTGGQLIKPVIGILGTVWPVLLAIVLHAGFKLNLTLGVIISLVLLILIAKPKKTALLKGLKEGFSLKLVFLIYGILSFQAVLEKSGGIESIPKLASSYNLPPELMIFLVCFATGVLTGMVSAYVGLGYTLLAGLLYQPEINPGYIMIAYFSGFMGMILSPSHLCLVLTCNYFKADMTRIFRILIPPIFVLGLIGLLIYISGYPELFR